MANPEAPNESECPEIPVVADVNELSEEKYQAYTEAYKAVIQWKLENHFMPLNVHPDQFEALGPWQGNAQVHSIVNILVKKGVITQREIDEGYFQLLIDRLDAEIIHILPKVREAQITSGIHQAPPPPIVDGNGRPLSLPGLP